MRYKIGIVGAGNVGGTTAQRIAERNYVDIVLLDIPEAEGLARGKALDIQESGPVLGYDSKLRGGSSHVDLEGCDLIIVTAGSPRKPGMSRDDLVTTKQAVMNEWGSAIIAEALNVSVTDVTAFVLGGHGDAMVPLPRYSTVAGVPLPELMAEERIRELTGRTANGGAEIVNLLKSGSAFYAPSASVLAMVDSILLDQKRVLPCSVRLQGEYGHEGIYLGVPVKLGERGVEEIVQITLSEAERSALDKSAESVRELVQVMARAR